MTKFTAEFIAEQEKMAKKAYMAEASDADVGLYRSYAAVYYPKALAEIERLEAELKITDELLKEATETIGAVVACCTYNSNDDAKIGIYGIDQKAFTRIDQFITHYNDAISAGKVSVDVKRELTDAEIEELGAQEAELRIREGAHGAYCKLLQTYCEAWRKNEAVIQ